ncbi:MAG: zinc metalloprotease HtpX [Acidilobaceae archaeon]|nr:zinc metalloprotease HtpX [Acidilobaceae archaeon]MDW7973823.1 zinc metalloprotease HtpX [Sulfolobales archaeon]
MILELLFAQWWILIVEALVLAGVVALLALNADRIVGDAPRSLLSLRFSMGLTLVFMISAYVGLMILAGRLLGLGGEGLVITATVLAFLLVAVQWLLSPFMINLAYRTRPPENAEEQFYASEAARLAKLSGISPPKFVIAEVDFPNAFAYGSPISGNYVAVTRGLLRSMTREEIIAVIGHEVGHLKHRDVTWILALSIIPLAIFFLGRALIYAGVLGGGSEERRSSPIYLLAIGAVFIAAGVLFQFLIAHFNRLREYYADAHSALVTGNPRALQRALARLHLIYSNNEEVSEMARENSTASMLFIVAPLIEIHGGFFYNIDYHVERLKKEKTSPIEELFASHPPIPKRLRFLDRVALKIS